MTLKTGVVQDYDFHVEPYEENEDNEDVVDTSPVKKKRFDREIPCFFCVRTFTSKGNLQMHMKSQHKGTLGVLRCDKCPDIFGTQEELDEHVTEGHVNSTGHTCPLCPKWYPTGQKHRLSLHIRKDHPHQAHNCDQCKFACLSDEELEKHVKNRHKPVEVPGHICPLCSKGYPSTQRYRLYRHIREWHATEARNCDKCGFSWVSEEELREHVERRHESMQERVQCNLCDVSFAAKRRYMMSQHIATEHADVAIKCSKCKFVCASEEEMEMHLERHKRSQKQKGEKMIKCDLCGQLVSAAKSQSMRDHIRANHLYEALKCQECAFLCLSREEFDQHVKNRHSVRIKCSLCGEEFPITKMFGLSEHVKANHPERAVKCQECDFAFATEDDMQSHVRRYHPKEARKKRAQTTELVICTICGVELNKMRLKLHMIRKHGQESKFTCRHCGKGFTAGYLLRAHEFSHNSVQPFACHCGKRFKTMYGLKTHRNVHQGGRGSNVSSGRNYPCTFCGHVFNVRYLLDNHRYKEHQDQLVHKCDKCGKGFESVEALAAHKAGEGPRCERHVCRHCGMECHNGYFLHKHEGTHPELNEHLCTICGGSFRTERQLKEHLDIHTGQPKYQCQLCPKKFFTKQSLHGHRIAHWTERKYKCKVCGKAFKTSCKLKNHFVIHTGEKNHVCDICGKAFNHSGSLWLHRKDVHKLRRDEIAPKRAQKNKQNRIVVPDPEPVNDYEVAMSFNHLGSYQRVRREESPTKRRRPKKKRRRVVVPDPEPVSDDDDEVATPYGHHVGASQAVTQVVVGDMDEFVQQVIVETEPY